MVSKALLKSMKIPSTWFDFLVMILCDLLSNQVHDLWSGSFENRIACHTKFLAKQKSYKALNK